MGSGVNRDIRKPAGRIRGNFVSLIASGVAIGVGGRVTVGGDIGVWRGADPGRGTGIGVGTAIAVGTVSGMAVGGGAGVCSGVKVGVNDGVAVGPPKEAAVEVGGTAVAVGSRAWTFGSNSVVVDGEGLAGVSNVTRISGVGRAVDVSSGSAVAC